MLHRFDEFLSQGGAESDTEVVGFLTRYMLSDTKALSFEGMSFGCSTLSVKNEEGNFLFGRNFDWNTCEAMIVSVVPESRGDHLKLLSPILIFKLFLKVMLQA